jgi:hypothetical protein
VTKEEISKILNEWSAKRDALPCPMSAKECIKESCRFYTPRIEGRVIGENLPPLLSLTWMCQFDQVFNQMGSVLETVSRAKMPAVTRPGLSGLSIPPGQSWHGAELMKKRRSTCSLAAAEGREVTADVDQSHHDLPISTMLIRCAVFPRTKAKSV